MRPAVADLDARQPVWLALSDLYLDTGYRSFVRVAARELAHSVYTPGELRAILLWRLLEPRMTRARTGTGNLPAS